MESILIPATELTQTQTNEIQNIFSLELGLNLLDDPLGNLIYGLRGSTNLELAFLHDPYEPKMIVSISKAGQTLAFLNFERDYMLKVYKKPKSFLAKTIKLADTGEIKPDLEYFQDSRDALGVEFDEDLDSFVLPKEYMNELILSYIFLAKGLVEIRNCSKETGLNRAIVLNLIYLGDVNDRGDTTCWVEEYFVLD